MRICINNPMECPTCTGDCDARIAMTKKTKFSDVTTDVSGQIEAVVETRIADGRDFLPAAETISVAQDIISSTAGYVAPVERDVLAEVDALVHALCKRFDSGGGCPLGDLRQLQRDIAKLRG